MSTGVIYKITSPSNKVYIGQTIQLNIRKIHYKNLHCYKQNKIYNSIKKYGWDNHHFEIIEECEKHNLNEREKYWIEYYNSFNNGLNLTSGGDNCQFSEESKQKISNSKKGEKNPMYGKTKHLSHRYGSKASKETLEKLRISHLGKMKGKDNPSFKGLIYAYKDNKLVGIFESSNEAGLVLKANPRNIRAVILGNRKTANGYFFTRAEIKKQTS